MTFHGTHVTDPLEAAADVYADAVVAGHHFPSPARVPIESRLRSLEDAVVALHDAVVKLAAQVERIDGIARTEL